MPSSVGQIHVNSLVCHKSMVTRTLSYELSDFLVKPFYSTILKRLILSGKHLDAIKKRDCGW